MNSICFQLNVFNFFEYLIQCFGRWKFFQCFLGCKFPNRFKQSIKANMRKESWWNTPSWPTIFLSFFKFLFDSISVDDFVVTASNITTSEPFKLFTSLKKETSFRNSYWDFFSSSQPDKESWVSAFSVNCEEIKIFFDKKSGNLQLFEFFGF